MLKPPKWLWFMDLTVGVVFVSGIASFLVWRRSEDFRKDTFTRVPRIADYFYRAEDIIGGQLRGTRLKRKDYHKWFPEEDEDKQIQITAWTCRSCPVLLNSAVWTILYLYLAKRALAILSGMSACLVYEKWKKKQPPKPMPIQSLERFERMMESMEGSMMRPKTNN